MAVHNVIGLIPGTYEPGKLNKTQLEDEFEEG